MVIPKWPVIGFALAACISLGAAQGEPAWVSVEGLSPAPVQGVVAIDSVLLASGSRHVFRTVSAEGPWSDTLVLDYGDATFLQALDSLVFVADNSKLLRSADHGLTWQPAQMATMDLPRSIFKSNGSLAMVTSDGLYQSSQDNGLTWSSYQPSPSGYAYGQLLIYDSLLFAGTDNGLYVSANHGGKWKRLQNGLPDGQIIMLERVLGKLFIAVIEQGLFVSPDLGKTWTKVDGGLARSGVEYQDFMGMAASRNLLLLASSGPGGVMGSRDSGKTWTPLNQGLPSDRSGGTTRYQTFGVAFKADTALVATSAGIYRSTNGGAQWSSANQGLPPSNNSFIGLSAAGSEFYASVFANESGPAYRSADGGKTWKKADSLLDGMRLMRTEGNDWCAMTDRGIARSADAGKTWISVPGPWRSSQGPIAFDFRGTDLAVAHHFDGSTLFYSIDKGDTWTVETDSRPTARLGGLLFQAAGKRLRVSPNDGRTWTDLSMQFPDSVYRLHTGAGLLALLSGSGLYVSVDSGQTWKRPGGLLENVPVNSITVSGSRLYAATRKGLMLSLDAGGQWKVLGQGLPVADIQAMAASDGRLFIADLQGLRFREGSALDWKALPAAPAGIQQLAVWKDIMLAATQSNRLWISRDAGKTWDSAADSLTRQPILSMALGPTQGFVSESGRLYRTADSGKTWETVRSADLIPAPTAMALTSANLFAVAGNRSYRSGDGGVHWSLLPATLRWAPTLLAAESVELYGADVNGVHYSLDEGEHWTMFPPIPFNPLARLAFTIGQVYIAGQGGNGIRMLGASPTGLGRSVPGIADAGGIRLETRGGMAEFRFDLVGNGRVTWEIYSPAGRRVGAYASRKLAPGTYVFPLGKSYGVLLYRAEIRPEDPSRAPLIRVGKAAP